MINVWFDGWFSSAYNIIDLIKNNPEKIPIKIFGSHHKEMGYKVLCDSWTIRPNFTEYRYEYDYINERNQEEYLYWALDFCEENKIDVFFPCKYYHEIAYCREDFEQIGTKIVIPKEGNTTKQLLDKIETYCLLNESCDTPPMWCLNKLSYVEDFKRYLEQENFKYDKLCIKPKCGTGGSDFRILNYPYDVPIIQEMMKKNSLVIMPYLNGDEISVDCLRTDNGLLAIPRYKNGKTRIQEIKFEPQVMEMVESIDEMLDIDVPYNIQFKKHNKRSFLLEINPRMSGGIYLSALAGANIPYLTVKKMLGEKIEKPDIKEMSVCNVERGIII